MALACSGGIFSRGKPRTNRAAFPPAVSPCRVTKSARSMTLRLLPQAKTPGRFVCKNPSVTAPFVVGSTAIPALLPTSFSGMRPTESRSVSQSTRRAVSGLGWPWASTRHSSTPSTRLGPKICVTVVLRYRGMPKS